MMKKLKVATLLMASTMLLGGCPKNDWHKEILIVNNSDKDLAFAGGPSRFDNWPCSGGGTMVLPSIRAGSSFILTEVRGSAGYEGILDGEQTVNIIVTDYETWDQYWREPCDTIRKYVPILHRYRLTLEDLQKMNWTVVYPPEE